MIMKRLASLFLSLLSVSISFSQTTPNISGDWDGPNDLILHFTYNPTTKNVKVDYCGIYRVMEWNPTARIENGELILTQKDTDGCSFSGRLRINSKDKMTGNITRIGYGESYFEGTTSLTRSSQQYYAEIMGMPGNNPDIDTSYSGDQSSDNELNYAPLSNEVVKPAPQVPESVWKKNWKLVYGKDKFGDENRSDPMLVASSKYGGVLFIISPLKGIFIAAESAQWAIIDYDNSDLSIKTKEGIKEMTLNQLSKTVFQLTSTEDNIAMLDILDAGHFKLALELSEYGRESKIINAEVTDQTVGAMSAMEYYFMDIPGFQDAWQFYGD